MRTKKQKEALQEQTEVMAPKRKCHTCGKPTHNYWCAECRKKRRQKYGITDVSTYGERE